MTEPVPECGSGSAKLLNFTGSKVLTGTETTDNGRPPAVTPDSTTRYVFPICRGPAGRNVAFRLPLVSCHVPGIGEGLPKTFSFM